MAEEQKDAAAAEAAAAPPAQSKKKTIILIVVLVIVGLALAAGISLFVVTKMMGDVAGGGGGGEHEEEDVGPRYHDPGIFVKLGDPKEGVLVNVGGARSSKYLKASIIVEFNPGKKAVINEETHALQPDAEIKVNDIATHFLRATKIEDFDADKQDEFKKQLKDELNMALGSGSVYDVYITSFLLQ